jgi:TolB-like protein
MNPRQFFTELKRRNVYRVAAAYAVVAWLLIQLASILFPTFEAPAWVMKVFVAVVAAGFPLALIFAWAFELTPEGLKRTEEVAPNESITQRTGRKLTVIVSIIAAVAVALLLFQTFRPRSATSPVRVAPVAATGTVPEKSIAVLPFASLSDDKANEYFAHGIQDEILTRLAKIRELKVISRTSTQQYQSKPGNLAEIAKQLGVAHILEGSVQKAGDAVRVNVQLIRAETDSHLWADTYDRKLTDIFAVETEVAQKIASSLEAQLTGREQQEIARVPTKNPEAYDAYLRGLALIVRQSSENVEKARAFFQHAVELDPNYAQAWAQLSIAESQLYFADETPAGFERARRAAETAVRLQPELSDAYHALGVFNYFCAGDYDRALRELDEGRKRSPNDATIILATSLVKRRQGKLDEAIELQKKATVVDPRNPDVWSNLARSYRGKRDFKTAREMWDRAFAVSPEELEFIAEKALTYMAEGDLDTAEGLLRGEQMQNVEMAVWAKIDCLVYRRLFEEAIQTVMQALEKKKGRPPGEVANDKSWAGQVQLWAGREAEGRALLQEAQQELVAVRAGGDRTWRVTEALMLTAAALGDRQMVEREAPILSSLTQHDLWWFPARKANVASAYALLGDADHAIPLLQEALSASYHRAITPALLRLDPAWDKIRSDPRFQKLAGGKP